MSKPKRSKLYVDAQVQGTIVRRVITYWVYCLAFLVFPLFIGVTFSNPNLFFFEQLEKVWTQNWPMLLGMACMLPFFVFDSVKLTNRFSGPVLRFRHNLQRLAEGEQVQPMFFREDDFWQEMALDFNRVIDRINNAENGNTDFSDGSDCEDAQLEPVGSASEA